MIVYESKWSPRSSRINFVPFRGPLFLLHKPGTGQELFFAISYSKPALPPPVHVVIECLSVWQEFIFLRLCFHDFLNSRLQKINIFFWNIFPLFNYSTELGPDSQAVRAGVWGWCSLPLVTRSNLFAVVYVKESLSPSTKMSVMGCRFYQLILQKYSILNS